MRQKSAPETEIWVLPRGTHEGPKITIIFIFTDLSVLPCFAVSIPYLTSIINIESIIQSIGLRFHLFGFIWKEIAGKDCKTNFQNKVFEMERKDNAQVDIDLSGKSDDPPLRKQGEIHDQF